MKVKSILIALLLITTIGTQAQQHNDAIEQPETKLFVGLGMGFDYGGFGGKLEYLPIKQLGLFGSAGYNLAGLGYNFGASFKILPDKKVTPAIIVMYGYNGVIKLNYDYGDDKAETYYGVSAGAGIDCKMGRRGNKLSAYLLVPFRSAKFFNDHNYLESSGVTFEQDVIPVAFSVGYNFALN